MKALISIVLLVLANVCLASSPDTFQSITVGFEITKPATWQFITAQENLNNLSKVKLEGEEFQRMLQNYATAPLVAMMKYPEPFDDVNPSFKVNIKPMGGLAGMSPEQILELISSQLQKNFKDFKMDQTPTAVEVSGLKGAYMRITYTMVSVEGKQYPTTSEMWLIPKGDYYYMMGAGTRQDEKTGSRTEIQTILKSVKIQ